MDVDCRRPRKRPHAGGLTPRAGAHKSRPTMRARYGPRCDAHSDASTDTCTACSRGVSYASQSLHCAQPQPLSLPTHTVVYAAPPQPQPPTLYVAHAAPAPVAYAQPFPHAVHYSYGV